MKKEKRKYTVDDLAAVNRVRACNATEYYEILEVKRECCDADVKKAYHKLALALHPDKNSALGADEAFKMVCSAFQVLLDPQKREICDRSGGDPESKFSEMWSSGPSLGFPTGLFGGATFGGELSPEELYNTFGEGSAFGASPAFPDSSELRDFRTNRDYTQPGQPQEQPQAPATEFHTERDYTQRARPQEQQKEPATPWSLFIQLLPLILFAFSLLSALPNLFTTPSIPDPRFSTT